MEAAELLGVLVVGFAAGMLGGLIGVGGGVLFVPGLVLFFDESQLGAVATSLVATVMVAVIGAWRQREYGNVRVADGLTVGGLAVFGVAAGSVLANALSERALELAFAGLQLYLAWGLARRALEREPDAAEEA